MMRLRIGSPAKPWLRGVLSLVLLSGFLPALGAEPGRTVFYFGDSLIAGSGLPVAVRATVRWPALLERLSGGRRLEVNEGRAGRSTDSTAMLAPLGEKSPAQSPASELAAEYQLRNGLPHVQARIRADQEVRVAFLGGSITAADGWRVRTMENLRRAFPQSVFTEIFAAVPGTGSDYGAARLRRDVLRHHPDLLFVEFAVNDGEGSPRVGAQMEGIVRQALTEIPLADICFVYTVASFQLNDLLAGGYQSSAKVMEEVASHYGIPSFNFGIEVAHRLRAERLIFAAQVTVTADGKGNDPRGRLIFTRDSVHPTVAGHRLYAERLSPALMEMLGTGRAGSRQMPPPLHADNWQRAQLIAIGDTRPDRKWRELPAEALPATRQRAAGLVPPTWMTFEPGAALEFHFKGTGFGVIGLKGPDNGEFRVTIDGQPRTGTLFDSYSIPGHYYLKTWFYPSALDDTEHHVRIELQPTVIDKAAVMAAAGRPIADPEPFKGHGLYLSGFAIVGELLGAGSGPGK